MNKYSSSTSRECQCSSEKYICTQIREFWEVLLSCCQSDIYAKPACETIFSVLRKSLYRDAKEPISWHEIGFIGMQYGHYQSAKWPLLQHYEKKTDLSRYEYAVYIQLSRHARFYFAKKYCKDFLLLKMNIYAVSWPFTALSQSCWCRQTASFRHWKRHVQICAYSSVRATTIRIISHIKMNKNVLFWK